MSLPELPHDAVLEAAWRPEGRVFCAPVSFTAEDVTGKISKHYGEPESCTYEGNECGQYANRRHWFVTFKGAAS